MKIWLLNYHAYGDVSVYSHDSDILNVPTIKGELEILENGYEDERDEFLADVERIKRNGSGEAGIEERFSLELLELEIVK